MAIRYDDRDYDRGPKGYCRSDERIREDVNDRLGDDYYIEAAAINLYVIGLIAAESAKPERFLLIATSFA